MNKKIIIYFTIFGLLFALFNFADSYFRITGGYDTPRSMIFNLPAMFATAGVDSTINKIQNSRFRTLKERVGLPPDSRLDLSKGEFNSLTPEERQTFLSKVELYKRLALNDFVIGQKGIISKLNSVLYLIFPIVSAIAWGIIGAVFFLVGNIVNLIRKKTLSPRR